MLFKKKMSWKHMEMKALRFTGSGSPACIAIPRMDFALEKHLPSKLFMINELAFSNIFCPLAPALTRSRALQL